MKNVGKEENVIYLKHIPNKQIIELHSNSLVDQSHLDSNLYKRTRHIVTQRGKGHEEFSTLFSCFWLRRIGMESLFLISGLKLGIYNYCRN